jgi:hypothetical protein
LQLGRAYALQGDTAKAKAAYQDFLTLWKDADSDIPILKQAKAEYAKPSSAFSFITRASASATGSIVASAAVAPVASALATSADESGLELNHIGIKPEINSLHR